MEYISSEPPFMEWRVRCTFETLFNAIFDQTKLWRIMLWIRIYFISFLKLLVCVSAMLCNVECRLPEEGKLNTPLYGTPCIYLIPSSFSPTFFYNQSYPLSSRITSPPPPNYLVKIPLCKLNSQEIVSYITQELDKGKKRFNPPPTPYDTDLGD